MAKEKNSESVFTVKDLIKFLQILDPDLPIGRVGHFGEFNPMDSYDFHVRKVENEWRNGVELHQLSEPIYILNIESPDIGPEPD